MDATCELTKLSGLQQLRAIFAGKTGHAGVDKTLDLKPVSAEEGLVVFEGSPDWRFAHVTCQTRRCRAASLDAAARSLLAPARPGTRRNVRAGRVINRAKGA